MGRQLYDVVATLGPATATIEAARALVEAGATALRINTSHVQPSELPGWLARLRPLMGSTVLYLDLQGSKWRVGDFEPWSLAEGARVELAFAAKGAHGGSIPVPHQDFFSAAALSDGRALLDDAGIELRLEETGGERAAATVLRPGILRPRKGITLPATPFRRESLTSADAEIVGETAGLGTVRYAVSYVKDGLEAAGYRSLLRNRPMVAKLERPSALAEAAAIAEISEGMWLCRGDLGAEMGLREMAEAVHRFARGLAALRVPVLMAGQLLEHMTEHPVPTRSEACHLYDVLAAGFRGVVLSDETAVGRHPVESVRVVATWNMEG